MPPKQAYRGGKGRGGHHGDGVNAKKEFEKPAQTHAERAAELLARARAAATPVAKKEDAAAVTASATLPSQLQSNIKPPQADGTSNAPIALPIVLKSLVSAALGVHAFRVKDAIPLAGKLVRAKLNTPLRLAHLNEPVLDEAGITGQHDKDRILMAFGVRALGSAGGAGGGGGGDNLKRALASVASSSSSSTPAAQQAAKRRRRAMDDEALSREYGNVRAPDDSASERGLGSEQIEYTFHEVLDEAALRGRFALVNRAPIMAAWATIVLERLGFQRREALSLAHCYVNTTSTARGISLGIIASSERERHAVGSNQPHFTLMGVKIPLMKLSRTDEWRGISKGEVVGPDQAFNYMRKSMYQTLPVVLGALTVLADSYVNANDDTETKVKAEQSGASSEDVTTAYGPDALHEQAYALYTQFRPDTAGEWGKKSMFYCSKALALRRGYDGELALWEQGERKKLKGDEEDEAQLFEEELRALVKAEGGGRVAADVDEPAAGGIVKTEEGGTVKTEDG